MSDPTITEIVDALRAFVLDQDPEADMRCEGIHRTMALGECALCDIDRLVRQVRLQAAELTDKEALNDG